MLFDLIQFYLIIKKESRKIQKGKKTESIKSKTEKNEFRKKKNRIWETMKRIS